MQSPAAAHWRFDAAVSARPITTFISFPIAVLTSGQYARISNFKIGIDNEVNDVCERDIESSDVRGVRVASTWTVAEFVPVPPPGVQFCNIPDPVRIMYGGGGSPEDNHGGAGEGAGDQERDLAVVRSGRGLK